MLILVSIFIFILGTIIGSFLNVVVLRHNTGMSVTRGRSQCFSCGKTLVWFELVPLASFFWLRGKCRGCKSKISWQYPAIEFITGVLFLLAYLHEGFSFYLPSYFFIMSVLVVIAVYDLRHKIIPDDLVFLFGGVSFILAIHGWLYGSGTTLLDVFAGLLLALPFGALWLFSKGKWIGLGDAKLMLGIGFLLGFTHGVSAVVLAFWIGALWSIGLLLVSRSHKHRRRVTMKSEIPFGPFLIIATLLVFFFGWDVMGLSSMFGI